MIFISKRRFYFLQKLTVKIAMVTSESINTNQPHQIFSDIFEKVLKFQGVCSNIKNVIQVQSRRCHNLSPALDEVKLISNFFYQIDSVTLNISSHE